MCNKKISLRVKIVYSKIIKNKNAKTIFWGFYYGGKY